MPDEIDVIRLECRSLLVRPSLWSAYKTPRKFSPVNVPDEIDVIWLECRSLLVRPSPCFRIQPM